MVDIHLIIPELTPSYLVSGGQEPEKLLVGGAPLWMLEIVAASVNSPIPLLSVTVTSGSGN